MKSILVLMALVFTSLAANANEKSACLVKYDLVEDQTAAIFYYEVAKYDNTSKQFKSVKQWYCEDAEVTSELPKLLEDNCTIINVDGIAIRPNTKGSFDVSFGCG